MGIMERFFEQPIDYLSGFTPHRAAWVKKELRLFTLWDLLQHFPFRHEDRSSFHKISEIQHVPNAYIQVIGSFTSLNQVGYGRGLRLVGVFGDETEKIEVIWFKRIQWIRKNIKLGSKYLLFGKPSTYRGRINVVHPELTLHENGYKTQGQLVPIYHTTEKLKKIGVETKFFTKNIKLLLDKAENHITEILPKSMRLAYNLIDKKQAIVQLHFPTSIEVLEKAQKRLKFEELFFVQLKLLLLKTSRLKKFKGVVMNDSSLLHTFYKKHLAFTLTDDQKKVIKEIYADLRSGSQMNRLIQGEVGSGKTMVAFFTLLIAVGSGFQCAFMAPTEVLAEQHTKTLQALAKPLGLTVAKLTGSTTAANRKILYQALEVGMVHILVGTHALSEDKVKFKNLGLAIIDEQHKFGVAQRAKLWTKNPDNQYPHILIMTATPIPRTLAMTLYGDLEISIIKQMPKGRLPVITYHFRENKRIQMFHLIQKEIQKGRQVYIIYPLIEESETLDYKDLMDGYKAISKQFPDQKISILHGRMKPDDKEIEMQNFVKGNTQIMVATTVIEVGVDVANASIIVIESAERFGLSQLHQLRGRVGRSNHQSYCVLMTGLKLTKEALTRTNAMTTSNDGFVIAETDLKLRGPGDLTGTQQSGDLNLKIADLASDAELLMQARKCVQKILQEDPELIKSENQCIKSHIAQAKNHSVNLGKIG